MSRWGKFEMDRSKVFPVFSVPSAFGLPDVGEWFCSPINDGPVDVFSICWGSEEYLLAWAELRNGSSSVGLVKLGTLTLLAREEVVLDSLNVDWLGGFTWALKHPIV